MGYSLRCPACRVKFAWNPVEGFPEECPNPECTTRIAHDRADDDVVVPFISTSGKSRRIDQTYRDIEQSSIERAEMVGDSSLKITDLRPTKHEGDVAAPPLTGSALELQNHMDAINARGGQMGFGAGPNGVEWSAGSLIGPEASAGARMRTALQSYHGQISHGTAVSDVPAKETQQPGYRRRG